MATGVADDLRLPGKFQQRGLWRISDYTAASPKVVDLTLATLGVQPCPFDGPD